MMIKINRMAISIAVWCVLSISLSGGGGGPPPGGPPGGGPGRPPPPPGVVQGEQLPPVDRSGPFFHQVKMAYSSDGLNWQYDDKVIFDHASVPGALLKKDGTLLVYFVDGMRNDTSVGISRDLGQTWDIQPVNVKNLTAKSAVDPDPMELSTGAIRLYYLGWENTPTPSIARNAPAQGPVQVQKPAPESEEPPLHKVYSAISRDGVNFVEEAGVRYAAPGITDPDVIQTKKWWRMFLSVGQDVLSAYSQDGLKWVADKGERGYFGAVTSTIQLPDGRLRMYISARGIESMISRDGLTWEFEDGVRISARPQQVVADPSVVQLQDGSYLMFYKTMNLPPPPELPGPPRPPGARRGNNPGPPPPK
ncbi:MAG: hypothetical protein ACREJQ_07120 [bacterium]